MARVNEPAARIHAQLVSAEVPLTASQVANALNDRLGPPAGVRNPVDHWRALSELRRGKSMRLPKADVAAIELAFAGVWCERLPEALIRFGVTSDTPLDQRPWSQAEARGEQFMAQAGNVGDSQAKPYGAKLASRLLAGGAIGDPWSETHVGDPTAENVDLHRLGRSQAVAVEFAEVLGGASAEASIDPIDMSQVAGFATPDLAAMTARVFDSAFGSGWLPGFESRIRNAEPDSLVAAVQAANALLPVFESLVVTVDDGAQRWQVLAAIVPLMLALPDLLSELGCDPRLFAELLESTPPELLAGVLTHDQLLPAVPQLTEQTK